MTFLRNFFKAADSILTANKSLVISKNSWNTGNYFGSKVEIPSPPKKPLTAYMIFIKENRKDVLKENPSLSSPQQIKLLAEKWNCLTEDKKRPYELSAKQNSLLYGQEHKKFYESLTEEQKEELSRLKTEKLESRRNLRLKKELRASGVPKLPCSAYNLFIQAEAKNKTDKDSIEITEFIKKVAEIWKSLPKHSKQIYETQAQEEKMQHLEEMKKWRARMILEGKEKLLQAYDGMKGKGKSTDLEDTQVVKRKATEKSAKESFGDSKK